MAIPVLPYCVIIRAPMRVGVCYVVQGVRVFGMQYSLSGTLDTCSIAPPRVTTGIDINQRNDAFLNELCCT